MALDNDYWDAVYHTSAVPLIPSQFAAFCLNEFKAEEVSVLELGCGNGRDTIFFARHNLDVTAVDASDEGIKNNPSVKEKLNLNFIQADLSGSCDHVFNRNFNIVYSRFFFHSIDYDTEQNIFQKLERYAQPETRCFFEFRTEKDEGIKKVAPKHFRRFVNAENFCNNLSSAGFRIDYKIEGFGYAKYQDEDAHVCRVVASKIR